MIITSKEQVDKVLAAYKAVIARARKDIVASQEKQAAIAAKERKKAESAAAEIEYTKPR